MKRFFLFVLIMTISFLATACTGKAKPTVELVLATAKIVTDKSISGEKGVMDGDKVIKYVTPTVLTYKFIVKNTSNQKIGDATNPVKFKLEPSEAFLSALRKTTGSDSFSLDLDKMNGGYQADDEIAPNGTAQYSVFFELGTEENVGADQQTLNNKRFDATLIITVGEEEIARFNLRTIASGLPQETKQKLEKELGTNMVVPVWPGYHVKFAEILYPPLVDNKVMGDRRVATIVYSDQKGPPIVITDEHKERLEKEQRRKFFYGEFEGEPLIRMEISNERNSLFDAKVQQIEGVSVEYNFQEVESGKYGIFAFNVEKSSYFITFQINETFREEDAVAFIRQILVGQQMGRS